jgi:predicted dehydrogenase
MRKFKIGIIGTGNRGTYSFGNGFQERPDEAEIIALCDSNPIRVKAAADVLGITENIFTDYNDLLKMKQLDIVVVATPDYTHEEIAVKAFQAGKHVLCEKPLALTVPGCDRIIAAAHKAGKQLEVGFVLRYVPFFHKMKHLLDQNIIGTPYLVISGDYYPGGSAYFRRWHRFKKYSGGLLVHKGTHTFDILSWMLGAKPVRVAAMSGLNVFKPSSGRGERCLTCENRCPEYLDITKGDLKELFFEAEKEDGYIRDVCIYNSEKDTSDNSTVIIEYDNGAKVNYSECFFCSRYTRRFLFLGPEGEIEGDFEKRKLEVYRRDNQEIDTYQLGTMEGGHGGGDKGQIAGFLRNLREGRPTKASGEAARTSIAIGVAAEMASEGNRVVCIEEVFK